MSAPSVATIDDRDHERRCGSARREVLDRDGGRVDVRERLVGLVDGDREQREGRADAAGRNRHRAAPPGR